MKRIWIRVKSKKAEALLRSKMDLPQKNKMTLKVVGYEEKVVSEEPYIVEAYFKKAPGIFEIFIPQIEEELRRNFAKEGLTEFEDYDISVVNKQKND